VDTKKRPLILVTNDDGIHAGGLKALIEVVRPIADVVVIAPEDGQSGMSHAITIKVPLRLNKLNDEPGYKVYTCSGTPSDCVKLAFNQVVDSDPDLVISGINHGSNASASVIYSGTMAAAIEGCLYGIPAIGFSYLDYSPTADFSSIKKYVAQIIGETLTSGLPKWVCLNVNIPQNHTREIKGMRICRQTKGMWREEFEKRVDPANREYYWLTGEFQNLEPEANDTDEWALSNGYVAIVPVSIDMTAYSSFNHLNTWKLVP
jgi:5'-nucleotidase